MKITMSTARKLAIQCQGLGRPLNLPKGKEGVAQFIERVGYVQIDTIAVIQRAHHHTLWARCPDYKLQMLHELQAEDRRVFEWWGHAASYLPMSDYRYYMMRMRANAESPKTREWIEQNQQLVDHVLERIRNEGPLGSSHFSAPDHKSSPWWGWKPAKRVLETLFNTGVLAVTERRNFQRIYDLTERVLPSELDISEPGEKEIAQFAIRRALDNRGFSSIGSSRWGMRDSEVMQGAIEELTASGEVVPLEIKGLRDEQYYALAENLEEASKRTPKKLHILSPFDNLVIDRSRLGRLFNFGFKLECYMPAAKRKFGYFCLPILWGQDFIGRLDPKADRKKKVFIVRKMVFEPGFSDYEKVMPALAKKLRLFADFNGCEQITVEEVIPEEAKDLFIQGLGS